MKSLYKKFVINELIIGSWWVFLFLLVAFAIYEQAAWRVQNDYNKLYAHLEEIQSQQKALLTIQEELRLQVNSQSDPSWIELSLIKGLGVIPENSTKVYFVEDEENIP